jgi:D-3-phosphoglycerate dehydrogenase
VIAYDTQYNKQGRAFPDFVEFVSFDELLKTSDVISIHCPLDKDAYHLFDKEAISLMKQSAYLINVVRGGIIDEDALLWALENKKIAGAGIDVVEHEPLNADSPLLQHDNFLVSPHTAWYSQQSVQELKRKAAEEAVRFLTGKPVRYPVNEIHRKEALSI